MLEMFQSSARPPDEDELLTVEDLMRIFQVSESTARKYYLEYGLRAVRLPGREIRFKRADVREFIERFCEVS